MKGKNAWIAVGGGIILLLIIFKRPQKAEPQQNEQVSLRAEATPPPPPPKAVGFHNSPELILERKLVAMEDNLKITHVPLPGNEKTLKLAVRFQPQKLWCQVGDLDIIRIDQRNDRQPPLLMTIEPLHDKTFKSQVRRIKWTQLQKARRFVFQLEADDAPRYLGLFICQDKLGDGSCRKKRLTAFSEIYDQYLKQLKWGSTAIGRYPVQDHLYYFQFLTIKNKRLYVGDPSLFEQKNYEEAFGAYIDEADASVDADELAKVVAEYSKNTGSLAAQRTEDGLVFHLPFNDPRCTVIQTR